MNNKNPMTEISNDAIEDYIKEIHKHFGSNFQYYIDNWNDNDYPKNLVYRRKEFLCIMKYVQCESGKILDVGVGGGEIPYLLSRFGFETYGLDDTYGNTRTKSERAKLYPHLKLELCDLERNRFPFETEMFDFITCLHTIEHFPVSPKHFLSEIFRVLKDRGRFYLSQPNIAQLNKRLSFLLKGNSPHANVRKWFTPEPEYYEGHVREYTLSEIEWMTREIGFKIIDNGHINMLYLRKHNFIHRLFPILTFFFRSGRDTTFCVLEKPS